MASSKLYFVFLFFANLVFVSVQQSLLPLTHSLSKTQFTSSHHLLRTTASLSAARHRRHRKNKNHRNQQREQRVSLPLAPGSDYTLTFTLNSQAVSVYMDTGSDVVWFPCSPFECILCEGKYPPGTFTVPPLNVSKSSLVSCKSPACSTAHSSISSSDLCAMSRCPLDEIETSDCSAYACPSLYYAYGDGSLIADLHKESLIMPSSSNKNPLVIKNFTFGCAHSTLGEPIGVAGFGRGSLSLPAQLGANLSPDLGSQFSYCLVSHSFDSTKLRHPSPLILGKSKSKSKFKSNPKHKHSSTESVSAVDGGGGEEEEDIVYAYTPMLENPKHPYFYSVGLEAVSVGGVRIPAPVNLRNVDANGDGGMVVDSGTTYTMLPSKLYNSIAAELDKRVSKVFKRAVEAESNTGLSPCFYLHGSQGKRKEKGNGERELLGRVVPSLALHFGRNSSVLLPRRNYFYEFMMDGTDEAKKGTRVGCLMMMDGGDESEGGPAATLGNYQQQGFEVVYDLSERRVGFARRECATLWNNLNSRT